MTSARGPDWDFYQCKCGNIVFEYNTITGEKCLSDTWKDCTVNCMEPVSYVPPCARPFTTVTIPVSRPRRHMATQTDEVVSTSSVDTQTQPPKCDCYAGPVLVASSTDARVNSDVNHASQGKEKSKTDLANTTEDSEENDGTKQESETENVNLNESKQKERNSKAKEKVKIPTPTKNESGRVLRKRKTDPSHGKGLGQASKSSEKSKRKA